MRKAAILLVCVCLVLVTKGQTDFVWQPGKVMDPSLLDELVPDDLFACEQISDEVFCRMQGKSFKKGCTVKREDLRYLKILHVNGSGQSQMGEMVCNKAIAADLTDIFRKLYKAGYRIERMVLVDDYGADDEASMSDNNTSCFNFRNVYGSGRLSKHSLGMAVDINPRYNPCLHTKTGIVEPANGSAYAYGRIRKPQPPYCFIDHEDLCYRLFAACGFSWGGDWKTNIDYQHFEKTAK